MPPSFAPRRNAATDAATALSVLSRELLLTKRMVSAAPGAIAWTTSASKTSSPKANQGCEGLGKVLTTLRLGAGRWNRRSNAAKSSRRSVTCGGESCDSASSGSTTVSPRPSIPRWSSGWTP